MSPRRCASNFAELGVLLSHCADVQAAALEIKSVASFESLGCGFRAAQQISGGFQVVLHLSHFRRDRVGTVQRFQAHVGAV